MSLTALLLEAAEAKLKRRIRETLKANPEATAIAAMARRHKGVTIPAEKVYVPVVDLVAEEIVRLSRAEVRLITENTEAMDPNELWAYLLWLLARPL